MNVDMIKVLNEETNGLTCMSKLIQADQKSIYWFNVCLFQRWKSL